MNVFLSGHSDVTPNRCFRVMTITCLTILLDLPILLVSITRELLAGQENGLNYPYISWANVHHDGAGGILEDGGLNHILRFTMSDWVGISGRSST